MMGEDSVWYAQDCTEFSRSWFLFMSPGARLAWMCIKAHVKERAVRRDAPNRAAAIEVRVAALQWNLSPAEVEEAISTAVEHGQLAVEDGVWIITNIEPFQSQSNEAKRKREQRERDRLASLEPEEMTECDPVGHGVTCRDKGVTVRDSPVTVSVSVPEGEGKLGMEGGVGGNPSADVVTGRDMPGQGVTEADELRALAVEFASQVPAFVAKGFEPYRLQRVVTEFLAWMPADLIRENLPAWRDWNQENAAKKRRTDAVAGLRTWLTFAKDRYKQNLKLALPKITQGGNELTAEEIAELVK